MVMKFIFDFYLQRDRPENDSPRLPPGKSPILLLCPARRRAIGSGFVGESA